MDGLKICKPGPHLVGHGLERQMLVGEQRVAAHGRYVETVEHRALGRLGQKAPVRMPVLCEDRVGLVRLPLYRRDMGATRNGVEIRILAKPPELLAEGFQLVVIQLLIGKGEHMMVQPGGVDLVDLAI